jgi:uncharacterized protein (TIGR00255 family)
MIKSMTAFAKQELSINAGNSYWELRSVNNRFLDLHCKLPERLRDLEADCRQLVKKYCLRGKLDCLLRVQLSDSNVTALSVNKPMLAQLHQAAQAIEAVFEKTTPASISALLKTPGLLQAEELDLATLKPAFLGALEEALKKLVDARLREGEALGQLILQRLDEMASEVAAVKPVLPEILSLQAQRLRQRLLDAQVEVDEAKLAQEMVYLAQKSDVTEELDRLAVHMGEMRRVLKQTGGIGRRLDFLSQEMHREANTFGAKSLHEKTTQAAINLKVLIEQIREQVQNIE